MARRPRRWLRRLRLAAEVLTVLCGIGATGLWCSLPSTQKLADENPTSTAFIDLRREQAAGAGKPFKLSWEWRPLGKISRYLRAAAIYAEDARFYTHDGVDWEAIEMAFDRNLSEGGMSVGGSTITQQLAKNLYLSPRRSVTRKLREFMITYRLEAALDKKRILELYLNVAEWGDGVFGAEAASRHWFHHTAASLTPAQAVRLAVALPNPRVRSPGRRLSPTDRKKADRLLGWMRREGLISASELDEARNQLGIGRGDQTPVSKPDAGGNPAPGNPTPANPVNPAPTNPSPSPENPPPASPAPADPAPADPAPADPAPIEAPPAAAPAPPAPTGP
jgi:monofunctional biosynthetic peptidoglycan transglycosylase